jgi:hypothetical protein
MKNLMAAVMAGATLSLAGSAMAQEACVRPAAPASVDGATATMDQLLANKQEVTAFMVASDAYQTCLINDLDAQRTAAKAAKTKVAKETIKATDDQISANQADKVMVGKAFNAAAKAYKAAHPS